MVTKKHYDVSLTADKISAAKNKQYLSYVCSYKKANARKSVESIVIYSRMTTFIATGLRKALKSLWVS